MTTSDWIAAASLFVSFAALGISWYGIRRANKTTSAATMVTLNEGFRQAWGRYFAAKDEDAKTEELAELLNLFEIACAIYAEKSITGNSRELAGEYLNGILRILVKAEDTKQRVTKELIQSETTFIFIKRYLRERKRDDLSVTIPPEWYQR